MLGKMDAESFANLRQMVLIFGKVSDTIEYREIVRNT